METSRYREQHEKLRSIAGDFPTVVADVSEAKIRGIMIKFMGTLRAHLATEDTYLYPPMMRHEEQSIRDKAERFKTEMGGLSEAAEDFYRKWSWAGRIGSDPEGFMRDWGGVRNALLNRMSREDDDLYATVDRSVSLRQSA